MNREIKFRCWNPKLDNMINDISLESLSYLRTERMAHSVTAFEMIYDFKDLVWMQFTGLYDKKGKEIFEGDIVSAWSEGYNHKGEIRWMLEAMPRIIIYPAFANQGFWKLHGQLNHNGKNVPDGQYCDDGVEIIGNIHQNPELLKK